MISVPDALARFPGSSTFTFGDSHELNVKILRLVSNGFKTVSCDAVANFEQRGERMPEPGRVDIALHNNGLPVLAHWREGYEAYLTRAGVFAPDAMMVVERFEVADRFM